MVSKSVLIILGSGLYDLFARETEKPFYVETPFGESQVSKLRKAGCNAYLMMRHGRKHTIPPHLINYRANISVAKELKTDCIIATASVGSLSRKITVGDYVVIDQFIDFTKNRPTSVFYDRPENFAHTDMTNPYSSKVRNSLISALKDIGVRFHSKGTYVCTEGPRFETPAEIRMYRKLGADVVGMTGVPEVIIANELGIPYASLCHVTNMAAGLQSGVSQSEVEVQMKRSLGETKSILVHSIRELTR